VELPRPPSPITDPQITVLGTGTELHRVHRSAFRPAEFNPGVGGQTRFAPFSDSAGAPVPSLYASATLRAAIHETILHDVPASAPIKTVRLNEVHQRTHSVLRTIRDLRLVELRTVTLGRWGISRSDLIASDAAMYGETVLWAAAIHRDVPDAHGLVWTSNQCDPDDACLFFGDRVDERDFATVRSRDGTASKSFLKDVTDEARLRGIFLTI
jgi:hypothetical protein